MKIKLITLVSLLFVTSCSPGVRYSVHEDNDIFSPHTNDDRDFTQGLKISGDVPDDSGSTTYSVGQNFYTPGHKQESAPQPNDRPYAAYLYGGAKFNYLRSPTIQDSFGLDAGIVGPSALGGQAQNTVHRWLGQNTAKGWRNQIHDEPGIIGTAQRQIAVPFNENFDLTNTAGANLGNVYTQGYLGSLFRAGYNLPSFFDSDNIIYPRTYRPTEVNSWRGYLFAGPYGRAVLRNIFLDGNTFRNSASIGKKTFVAEGRLGAAVEYSGYRLTYTYVVQTAEFDGQPNGNDFGELAVDWVW